VQKEKYASAEKKNSVKMKQEKISWAEC